MKKNSYLMLILALFGFSLTLNSCSDDDATPDKPTVIVPGGITTATIAVPKDLTLIAEIPGGYKSHQIMAANGNVIENSAQPDEGAKTIQIDVSFTGTAAGAGAVTLTVTDRNNKTDTGTIALNVVP